ncbi:ANTAR domain-containing protein [[Clostridium] leptum]|nr:ANTAR domain-containing protein [[Clostridium] leptum]
MPEQKEPYRVLVVSSSAKYSKLLGECLPGPQYFPIDCVATAGEAKRRLISTHYSIIIINSPLEDDFGSRLALDISAQYTAGILLLVKAELFEQTAYGVEDSGVVTLPKPTSRQMVYSAVKMLTAVQAKIQKIQRETVGLKSRMEEIRLVNRAKWVLIDRLKMTEPEAHRYIEKQAMDRCVKKSQVAQSILRTYE